MGGSAKRGAGCLGKSTTGKGTKGVDVGFLDCRGWDKTD